MFERTKALCDKCLELGLPGIDFSVYRDGKEFFRYMGGYSDVENGIPMQGNERFRIFSCTKPITVTAAMQLWEQGKFSLDDPVSKYMSAFSEMTVMTETGTKKAENPMLIWHLFTMTAGLSYNYSSPQLKKLLEENPAPTTRQVADALARETLLFEPGDRFNYSLCHDVLGALIEELSGESLQDYVKNHIFDPLGMEQSTYHLPEEEKPTVAALYEFDQETGKRMRIPLSGRLGPNYVSGGASCVSTTSDYMKFAEALRTGERLLKRQTIELMTTNQLSEHQMRTFTLPTMNYGLGMWTAKPGQLRQNFGWGGAAGAMLGVYPRSGLSMVIMQHAKNSPVQGLRKHLGRVFLAELEGDEDIFTETLDFKNYNLTY